MLEVVLAIPFWLELAATLTGGLSGAMSAVRARYDLFGVACIAIVTGLAGGIIRDVLLQSYGIYAFQKPSLIVCCVAAGVLVFYFGKLTTYLDPIVDLLDNLSVALWAIIAVGKSLSAGLDIIPAAILGTITAVGGGICRDICMSKEPATFQAGTMYGSAAFIGAFVYALMYQNHILANYAAMTCAVLVLGIRYASRLFDWHTKAPRDYSYLVTKPIENMVKKVRPPKGKIERERDRKKYAKAIRILKKLSGMPLDDQPSPVAPSAEPLLPYESRTEVLAQQKAQQEASAAASAADSAAPDTTGLAGHRASGLGARDAQVSRAMESAEVFRQAIAEEASRSERIALAGGASAGNRAVGDSSASVARPDVSDRIVVPVGELRKFLGHEVPGKTGSIQPLPENPADVGPDDRIIIPTDDLMRFLMHQSRRQTGSFDPLPESKTPTEQAAPKKEADRDSAAAATEKPGQQLEASDQDNSIEDFRPDNPKYRRRVKGRAGRIEANNKGRAD
ncbi:trimeric intracellular cation channel family protein [Xiamenia xianingshaonis]|uniref:Trimeric intracellular cation channel family protein n=1 Tax=Xiamenia xianingshaonis TaxID=2682776 RepID=A0A9E6STZ9_9ACTN|nr:trimeric intracellular cation channel family protein [Xiamenia xianingshaonis]NHM14118.1 hypothetical protein [Xiamenia xianingshaonis]QTU83980.1 trimeric intracellular cation channel family protein [Xiamenia xianingshaonis]